MSGDERTKHLCQCGSEWLSVNHTRCELCGLMRTGYSIGYQQGHIDATAAAKVEAYERGVAEERERCAAIVLCNALGDKQIQQLAAFIRTPSPACETAGEEE